MDEDRTRVLQPTTADAVAEARAILRGARHGALATLTPAGHPMATRVGLATLDDGRTPLLLVSALAAHTPQLRADPRCSLLVGEIGKGDPLAQARLTLTCRARELARGQEAYEEARSAYLAAHLKSKIYIDLPDFTFMALAVEAVSFVGGFGRAYAISAETWIKR